jgi:hypothetical protein
MLCMFGMLVACCRQPAEQVRADRQAQLQAHQVKRQQDLVKQCTDLLHEFQNRFDETAGKSAMPSLLSWYQDSLDRLMDQYDPTLVIETISSLCKTDSKLKHPVPMIVKTETESHNKTSGGDAQ